VAPLKADGAVDTRVNEADGELGMDIGLKTVFGHAFLPAMVEAGYGRVISVASVTSGIFQSHRRLFRCITVDAVAPGNGFIERC